MSQSAMDPTFYRTAAEAAAAPAEQIAYVVAFDRAAQKNDAVVAAHRSPRTDLLLPLW
jgi:selenium-binding protein 1